MQGKRIDGRDYWGDCSSALLAGGGIRGGQVLGASNRIGAFPIDSPVDPTDIQATIYHCLGLPAHLKIYDDLQRPFEISAGKVIDRLLQSLLAWRPFAVTST